MKNKNEIKKEIKPAALSGGLDNGVTMLTGISEVWDGFLALTPTESKKFKTLKGAENWLIKRDVDPNGKRINPSAVLYNDIIRHMGDKSNGVPVIQVTNRYHSIIFKDASFFKLSGRVVRMRQGKQWNIIFEGIASLCKIQFGRIVKG